jgi:hypothetical protein
MTAPIPATSAMYTSPMNAASAAYTTVLLTITSMSYRRRRRIAMPAATGMQASASVAMPFS